MIDTPAASILIGESAPIDGVAAYVP